MLSRLALRIILLRGIAQLGDLRLAKQCAAVDIDLAVESDDITRFIGDERIYFNEAGIHIQIQSIEFLQEVAELPLMP